MVGNSDVRRATNLTIDNTHQFPRNEALLGKGAVSVFLENSGTSKNFIYF